MQLRLLHAPVPAVLVEKLYAEAAGRGQTIAELATEILAARYADQPEQATAGPPQRRKTGRAAKS